VRARRRPAARPSKILITSQDLDGCQTRRPIGRREIGATRATFFISGLGMAAWAPLVPFVRDRLDLDSAQLGLLLLCLGLGAVLSMPFAGTLTARHGCRAVILVAAGCECASLLTLATSNHAVVVIPALFVFGAGVGTFDCVMNIQAIIVERAVGRVLMSGFHGFFSVGSIVGSSAVSGLMSLSASPLIAAFVVAAGIVLILAFATPYLLPYGGRSSSATFRLPRGIVMVIAALCFIMFAVEGSALDWSAVFLTTRNIGLSMAGLGYAAFSVLMTIGRFLGDSIVRAAGPRMVVVAGSFVAAAGIALAVAFDSWQVGIVGYAVLGAGCSSVVPVLYGALGRQTVMPEAAAVPVVTTIAYGGMLLGPAAIGLLAHAFGLSAALLSTALGLLIVSAVGSVMSDL
jgi:MFS family permease